MVHSIKLINFQKHKELLLILDKKITVLVGVSGSGKSAVLRAFRWFALNQPSGNSFIRRGAKAASVELEIDGKTGIRSRGKTENTYAFDGEDYKAFGSNVPDAIAKWLNVSSENFSRQMDAPFWFLDTPGQVSKRLNSIVNMDVIDNTLANLASFARKAKAEMSVAKDRLKLTKTQRLQLNWTQEADELLKELELNDNNRKQIEQECKELSSWIQQSQELTDKQKKLSGASKLGDSILKTSRTIAKLKEEIQDIESVLEKAKINEQQRKTIKEQLRQAEETLTKEMTGRCPICKRKLTA